MIKSKIFYLVILGIGSLHIKAQIFVSTPLHEHHSYFAGLVEKRKGNCEMANQLFKQEKSNTTMINHYFWKDKAESQIIVCPEVSSVSFTSSNVARVKIKKPRFIKPEDKNKLVINTSEAIVEKKPLKDDKTESFPVANTNLHYRVKIEESSVPNKSFISLADLGPIYSDEDNGRFGYYMASSNNEQKVYDLAVKISNRTNNKIFIEQCSQGKVVKTYTLDQFSVITAAQPQVIETFNKTDIKKSKTVVQSYVVVESLLDDEEVQKLIIKLEKLKYVIVTEKNGKYTNVGVVPKVNQSLTSLLDEVRQIINNRAWIRR